MSSRPAWGNFCSLKFYKGSRHEMLNETNREEVQRDVLAWPDGQVMGA